MFAAILAQVAGVFPRLRIAEKPYRLYTTDYLNSTLKQRRSNAQWATHYFYSTMAQYEDSLAMLRHNMAPAEPYRHETPAPVDDYFHPRAPTTLITALPEKKLVYPSQDPTTVYERNKRRLENTRGTFGAGVNLDGTSRAPPMIPDPSTMSYSVAPPEKNNLLFFGGDGGRNAVRSDGRHFGPRISNALQYESDSNLERKKLIQQELKKYEKIQLEERENKRLMERQQTFRETKWPFGHPPNMNQKFNHIIPMGQEEMAVRQLEKQRADEYARELEIQVESNRRQREAAKKFDFQTKADQQTWMMHAPGIPERRARVPMEPPHDSSRDLISHIIVPPKPPNEHKKLRPPQNEERKEVYPLDHDLRVARTNALPARHVAPIEPTSLPLGDHRKISYSEPNMREPQFGRKKFMQFDTKEERVQNEHQLRFMRQVQEEDLKIHREMEQRKRQEENIQGKQFGQSYPWHWGMDNETRKAHPHHKSTDIMQTTEPINKAKAMQYQADLNNLVRHRQAIHDREKQMDSELWRNFGFAKAAASQRTSTKAIA
ncbi:hypothetical protein HDU81_000305 [Chytriomyces hyalinus]|nr:hypothetical protein HDU81_000305 [Chytriomyces hyalinus]